MPFIAPRLRIEKAVYRVLCKDDRPLIIEDDLAELALRQGAGTYPAALDPSFIGWLEIPDDHFHQVDRAGWLEKAVFVFK